MSCASSSAKPCWAFHSSRIESVKASNQRRGLVAERTIWLGAVAYDPKVVTIWEGMRRYFHNEANLPVEVVLFQSYEAQVLALLAQSGDVVPRIDIAWNTNLAYLQADEWSSHAC